MKAFSFLYARLDVPGLCVIAALATACSSNASGLSLSAPPSPDGAVENPSVADAGLLFQAERHTNQSDFQIQTTLSFTNCGEVNGVTY